MLSLIHIYIASVGGLKGTSALSLYGASKAGVINLTKTMALEWSRYGIQTNAVCPGYVVTEINKAEFENEKFRDHVLKTIPQRRLGTCLLYTSHGFWQIETMEMYSQ